MSKVWVTLLFPFLLAAVDLPAGFDPQQWPGRVPPEIARDLQSLQQQIAAAQRSRDRDQMNRLIQQAIARLGVYAGVPETRPQYGGRNRDAVPGLDDVIRIHGQIRKSMSGRHGWELAKRAEENGTTQPRLRISFRSAMEYLRAWESGVPDREADLRLAIAGFDYIVSQQASTGAFGYPYDPKSIAGLTGEAARVVREGESRGIKMTEGRWVIEDLGTGGLQFDNGEAGAGLLYAYAVTGSTRYLDSARKAADWAAKRPLVLNWNYNSFSGWLLARLYRLTGEKKYLESAIDKFEYGVLPGQMTNGRWFDPHNASPQYHALMCRNLVEYTLALEKASHPSATEVRRRTVLALDSMAEETIRFGASNMGEGLPLEALTAGLLGFGDNPAWAKASHTYANFLLDGFLRTQLDKGEPRPQTLSNYLLYRELAQRRAKACEVTLKCTTAR